MKGSPRPFELRLQQTGAAVRGLFKGSETVTDVSGTVATDGSVMLNGSDPGANASDASMTARAELRVTADGALQGTVSYEVRGFARYAENYPGIRLGGEVIAATRSELGSFVADINGTWSGRFVVRSCTPPTGGGACYPVDDQGVENVDLTLAASGGAVSGTGTLAGGSARFPLGGTVTGSTVTLSGEALEAVSGGSVLVRVSEWNATIDEFGRMRGRFKYEHLFPASAPTLGGAAVIELWQVVKRP